MFKLQSYQYLKKNSEYKEISEKAITKKYRYLVVKYCKNSDLKSNYGKFTYGITITKKYGNSVKRNLLRRRLKSIINSNDILKDLQNISLSIYPKFIAKDIRFMDLKKEVDKILNNVKNY